MKTEQFKSVILANKQRVGVALLSFVCLTLVVFTPGAAQLRGQKRVTAIQLGGAAEGSRVTVVSDSPLSDYEAFRRGDRFHVKIPLADLSSAAPHFRADGFEDVQVQKVGDSLIVSFKLQPGATARVDQRGNRLDVVFSAPYRSSLNNTTTSGSRRIESSQTSADRGRDAAGPMPSDSAPASRLRIVTDRAGSVNVRSRTRGSAMANRSIGAAINKSTTGNVATASPSPLSSPSSILSPGNSTSYSPVTTTTSPAAASPTAAAGSSASSSVSNLRNGQAAVRQWMSANRLATLLGALILLSLVVYLAAAIRRPQRTVVKATRAKTPKVRPRYSADGELNELSSVGIHEQSPLRDSAQPPSSRPSAIVAPAQDQAWTSPTIVSPIAGYDELSSEAEEREVFEL